MGLFNPHIGSWGLPDFGITEMFTGNRTPQGGSNLFGPQQAIGPLVSPMPSSGPVGVNIPAPVYNPVPVQPQPQPQQQTSSGNFMDYYGGWGQREAAADFLSTFGGDYGRLQQAKGGGGSQPQVQNFSQEISDIYNPAFQNLQNQENYLRQSQLPTAMGQIATNTQELQSNLQGQKAEAERGFISQQGVIEQNRESALASAIRGYKGVLQQSQALYGGGSSTGPAISELANQAYLQSAGGIQQAYSRSLGTILDAQSKTIDWVARESSRIMSASKQQEMDITSQFNSQLMQINNAKGQLDAAKNAAKLQLLQEAAALGNQVKQTRDNYLMQLAGWKEQQQFLIDKGITDLKQQYTTSIGSSSQFAADAKTLGGIQPVTATPKPISTSYRYGQPKDEWAEIINPFA